MRSAAQTPAANEATMIRAIPLLIMLQPSHRKFCWPCMTPQKMGVQSVNSTMGKVTQIATGLLSCQRAMSEFCSSKTTTAPITQRMVVISQRMRMTVDSSPRQSFARARAVCWASTICNGSVGTSYPMFDWGNLNHTGAGKIAFVGDYIGVKELATGTGTPDCVPLSVFDFGGFAFHPSSIRAVRTSSRRKRRRGGMGGVSLPTDQIATEARFRSRETSSPSCARAFSRVSGSSQ